MSNRSLVQQHEEGIYQVRVPLPFPLRWVNAYLLKDNGGYTMIDPGLRTDEALACWDKALSEIGLQYSDIHRILLTHHHPDHVGLAGVMQQLTGANVYISAAGSEQMCYLWGERQQATEDFMNMYVRNGLDPQLEERMLDHLNSFIPLVSPLADTLPLLADSEIAIGSNVYRTIHAPGHAYGQLILWDESNGTLFCGDHVLPAISPNVMLLPKFDANPLSSYLESLQSAAELPVRIVYPGHREPFRTLRERCLELIAHHRERLDTMAQLADKPVTAFEVCKSVFGRQLSVHQLRFALGETISHLVYLHKAGTLMEMDDGSITRYVQA